MLPNKSRQWLALVGISMASFLGCIDFTIVNTALPAIQTGLAATVSQLQWIINIFIMALCALMVVMGKLADFYGRRKILYLGMAVFAFASLGAGLSPSINWLIAFRLLQGAATAVLYTATGAIISHTFPPAEKGKAMGTLFGINGIGLAIGPVVGGVIVGALSWRWVFIINVPIIIASFIICLCSVNESKSTSSDQTIDWLGAALLTLGLSALVLALIEGQHWG